jgi:hypothetical protein
MKDPRDTENFEIVGTVVREFHNKARVPLTEKENNASDRDLLERELNYKAPYNDRRFFKTRPPGYNVMTGLGSFFALTGFLLGAVSTIALLGRGVITEFVGCVVGLSAAAILGYKLPKMIWRGIGPNLRGPLRLFGYLGSGPILILCVLAFALPFGAFKGVLGKLPSSEPTPAEISKGPAAVEVGPLSGPDWQVLVDAENKPLVVSLAEAHTLCQKLGEGWRLPRLNDQAFINSTVTNPTWQTCVFHFDNGEEFHGFFDFPESVNTWCPHATMEDLPRQVLCLRKP